MTIIFDGTQGITTPTETANNSVTTPVVKSGSALTLQTNGSTTAVTIDTSQRVGIGKTPDNSFSGSKILQIGTAASFSYLNLNNSTYIHNNSYFDGTNNVYQTTNPASMIGLNYGGFEVFTAPSGTAGNPITYTRSAYINQYGFGIGDNAPTSGLGIRFPATQSASSDANTLDDYEEGTWTPNVYHDSSNNSTWAQKLGTYRKVGSIVHCWFVCDGGNSGTSGSQLAISGLPFTPTTTPSNVSFGIWGVNGITPNTGNIFNAGGTPKLYNGGNNLTAQISYVSGYFSYVAS